MSINDRTKRINSQRRAVTAAGIATLVFSLVISIGPAIAANGGNGGNGGNAGTVKIHDAATSLEAGETSNEPWVCEFWVGFYGSEPGETGTWQILSWAPTGNGSVVESGSYDTGGDGVNSTTTFALVEGHYRLEWQSTDDNNVKHKTFWVECEGTESEVESSPSADASASEESAPSDEASPSEEEASPSEEEASPSEEEASPSEESAPSDEESTPSDEESTPSDQESTPSDDESGEPDGSGDEPEGDVKGGNPESSSGGGDTDGNPSSGGGAAELPDTSMPVSQSAILATLGVLLIIAAHAGTRRERQLPSA